ncbi:AAA+ ATPase domain-containing protein [Tanacetum coccineum]
MGTVSEKMALAGKNEQKMVKCELSNENLIEKVMPLVQFVVEDLFMEVTHRTLGGAMAISSTLKWDRVQVDCAKTEISSVRTNDVVVNANEDFVSVQNAYPKLRADTECHSLSVSACIAGVCLAGGMSYAGALLHRFGILGPDGGPGVGLSKGLDHLSTSPLSKLFKRSPVLVEHDRESNSKLSTMH